MKLDLAARAARDAERHSRWWRKNRLKAPWLFDNELRVALDRIRSSPHVGTAYIAPSGSHYRRLLLPKTCYHVYFRQTSPDVITVAAIWSALRQRGPALR